MLTQSVVDVPFSQSVDVDVEIGRRQALRFSVNSMGKLSSSGWI